VTRTDDLGVLARDAALLPDTGRQLCVATGADRVRFLHGIVTGDVAGTPVGGGCLSALLTTKGHVVADMRMFVREDDIWIVVDAGQAEPVAGMLSRYAIMDDFAAAARPDFALSSLLGPAAAARLAAIGVDAAQRELLSALAEGPRLGHATLAAGDGAALWIARVRELGADGFWLGAAPPVLADVHARLAAAGTPALDPAAAEAARIVALEPRFGAEITPDYFPMEVGLGPAIDYNKGCYLGQEPIVRIRDRGHINWRLVGLDVVGPGEPAPRDALESDAKPKAGRITSAARLPGGGGVALAMLHTSVAVGATVRIHHGDDRIEARVRAEGAAGSAPPPSK
jgi:folate-binding protein YgfZ